MHWRAHKHFVGCSAKLLLKPVELIQIESCTMKAWWIAQTMIDCNRNDIWSEPISSMTFYVIMMSMSVENDIVVWNVNVHKLKLRSISTLFPQSAAP